MNKVNQRTELSISKFSLCILLTLVLSSCDNPSQNDIDLTKKLKSAGQLLDVAVLDHIIVGNDTYYSFADENLM